MIDQIQVKELVIDIKSFNLRRLDNSWYFSNNQAKDGNLIDLNSSSYSRFSLVKLQLKMVMFCKLRRLKLIFINDLSLECANEHFIFNFLLDKLFSFNRLNQFELEMSNGTLSKYRAIQHPNLKILKMSYFENVINFIIDCPQLRILHFGGALGQIKIMHPFSIRLLDCDLKFNLTFPYKLSLLQNLQSFHFFGNAINLNNDFLNNSSITEFHYDRPLEEISYQFENLDRFVDIIRILFSHKKQLMNDFRFFLNGQQFDEQQFVGEIDRFKKSKFRRTTRSEWKELVD